MQRIIHTMENFLNSWKPVILAWALNWFTFENAQAILSIISLILAILISVVKLVIDWEKFTAKLKHLLKRG